MTGAVVALQWNKKKSIFTLLKHLAWDPFQTDRLVGNEPNGDVSSQQDFQAVEKFDHDFSISFF